MVGGTGMNMTGDKRVLIVSFAFPPANVIGSMRVGKIAKYLPEFGWKPKVLAADTARIWPQTLPSEVDESAVVRTGYTSLNRAVSAGLKGDGEVAGTGSKAARGGPGWKSLTLRALRLARPVYSLPSVRELLQVSEGWYRPAVARGTGLAREFDFDLIFSTAGGASMVNHRVASRLHRITGIPWVADFRDLWSGNPYYSKVEPFHTIEEQWEKRTMRGSDLFLTVSEPLAEKLRRLHGKEVVVMPNGFDEQDYSHPPAALPRFTITYTGNIYPERQDPSPLFNAVASLRDEGSLHPGDLEIRFFGRDLEQKIGPSVDALRLGDFVVAKGLVPFEDSVARQQESTALLLLTWNDPSEKGVYTAKVFEYLGASRPILAVGMKGSVIDELLRTTGSGTTVSTTDEVRGVLRKWLEEFAHAGGIKHGYHPDTAAVGEYGRREQTRRLAEIFRARASGASPGAS